MSSKGVFTSQKEVCSHHPAGNVDLPTGGFVSQPRQINNRGLPSKGLRVQDEGQADHLLQCEPVRGVGDVTAEDGMKNKSLDGGRKLNAAEEE